MFASQTSKTIVDKDLQSGSDISVVILKLNWKKLRDAAEAVSERAMRAAASAPAAMLQVFKDAAPERPKQEEAGARYRQYDREIVLRAGVKSWSVAVPLDKGLDDLDEPVADRLHHEIIDLSLPPVDAEAALGESSAQPTTS